MIIMEEFTRVADGFTLACLLLRKSFAYLAANLPILEGTMGMDIIKSSGFLPELN